MSKKDLDQLRQTAAVIHELGSHGGRIDQAALITVLSKGGKGGGPIQLPGIGDVVDEIEKHLPTDPPPDGTVTVPCGADYSMTMTANGYAGTSFWWNVTPAERASYDPGLKKKALADASAQLAKMVAARVDIVCESPCTRFISRSGLTIAYGVTITPGWLFTDVQWTCTITEKLSYGCA